VREPIVLVFIPMIDKVSDAERQGYQSGVNENPVRSTAAGIRLPFFLPFSSFLRHGCFISR
jgi:hypothetical protein